MEHLAVFKKGDFLSKILDGRKTIESRFSVNKISPFGKVKVKDRVFIKESGGSVLGEFVVSQTAFFSNLNPRQIRDILTQYKDGLGIADVDSFLELKKEAKYGTLIWIKDLVRYSRPFSISKNDMQSWVILDEEIKKEYDFPEF